MCEGLESAESMHGASDPHSFNTTASCRVPLARLEGNDSEPSATKSDGRVRKVCCVTWRAAVHR